MKAFHSNANRPIPQSNKVREEWEPVLGLERGSQGKTTLNMSTGWGQGPVWGPWLGSCAETPYLGRQTDMTENITIPQLHWRAVHMTGLSNYKYYLTRIYNIYSLWLLRKNWRDNIRIINMPMQSNVISKEKQQVNTSKRLNNSLWSQLVSKQMLKPQQWIHLLLMLSHLYFTVIFCFFIIYWNYRDKTVGFAMSGDDALLCATSVHSILQDPP